MLLTDDDQTNDSNGWIALALTGIGFIPLFGSAIKGVGKVIIKNAGTSLEAALAVLRKLGKGDPVKYLRKIDWADISKQATALVKEKIIAIRDALNSITDSWFVKNTLSDAALISIKKNSEQLTQILPKVESGIKEGIQNLKSRMTKALDKYTGEVPHTGKTGEIKLVKTGELKAPKGNDLKGAKALEHKYTIVRNEFIGKYKGQKVTLKNIDVIQISYKRRSRESLDLLRKKFDSSIRKNYLKSLSKDPKKIAILKEAGFSEKQIAMIEKGYVPKGYNVHHKIPIDDGGTNDFKNLVLIRNNSEHYTITNAQRELTSKVPYGKSVDIEFPVPPDFLYPLNGH